MENETGSYNLLQLMGAFNFFIAGILVLALITTAFVVLRKRLKTGQISVEPSILLALSVAIFLWGEVASNWNLTNHYLIQGMTGGIDYTSIAIQLAGHSTIKSIYSFVALFAAILSMIFQLAHKIEPNKASRPAPDTDE